jgi:hypothetical protein
MSGDKIYGLLRDMAGLLCLYVEEVALPLANKSGISRALILCALMMIRLVAAGAPSVSIAFLPR